MSAKTDKQNDSSTSRWASYAKAAGVGALTMGAAGTADAAIEVNGGTHNDVSPSLPIIIDPVSYGYRNSFDIDGDGSRDFFMGTGNYASAFAQLDGANTAGMILTSAPNPYDYATAFAAGATIDSSSDVAVSAVAVIQEEDGDGPMGGPTPLDDGRAFLGFKTSLGYFGFMDVETVTVPDAGFNGSPDLQLIIHGWAVETSGAGIQTFAIPEPSSLAMLAAGSLGLAARRRRKAS